jgi:acyl-CoA synthetase (AMP-forming)/AMP-acid ligase II
MTYGELDERSTVLASRLVQAGVGKGSRVGLLFPNGVDWMLAWAAAARIGAITVPVNTFYLPPELARFLRHSDIQVLLGVPQFLQHDYVAALESIAPELSNHGAGPLYLSTLPQLRRVLFWAKSRPDWAESNDNGTPAVEMKSLGAIVAGMEVDVTPSDELLITYTSGSTGEPKGVVHSHGALIRHATNLAAIAGIDDSSRIWTPMPLCWVGGFVFSMLRALVTGGCFLTQETFEPGSALSFLAAERVTNVSAWPGVTKAMYEHQDFARHDFSAIRYGWYEAIPVQRRPRDIGLVIGSLGMSETCGPHTSSNGPEQAVGAPEDCRGSFGHEIPGTEHRIVDPEIGADVPEGQEGEVLVRGYSLMLGLYKRERDEVFDAEGWYHTGDRGYFRDGWFFFTGRQTDLIKSGGSNVAPAEVEQCLMAYDEVKLAFVVGVPDDVRGQEVVGLVVPWSHTSKSQASPILEGSELRERLRKELSSYKVPRQIMLIRDDQVPWLVSQKVDRKALSTLATQLLAEHSRIEMTVVILPNVAGG